MMRFNSRTTLPWLGAAMAMSVSACDCGEPAGVDAGGLPDVVTFDAGPPPAADLRITPALADFGDVVVGETSSATTFTIRNAGTAASSVISVTIGGADAGDFSFASNDCAGMELEPDETCTVSIEFSPSSVGNASATVTASDGDDDAVATLQGTGLGDAGLSISPTPHNFGSTTVGMMAGPQTFTVTNTGDSTSGTLNTLISGLDASQFQIGADSCDGMTLAAGATCTVEVTYEPTIAGTHMGSLVVSSSPGGSASAALQGTARTAPGLRLLPGAQDFGSVVAGASSSEVTFTLTNTGGLPTGTITHSFSGADATEFSVTTSTCAGAPLAGGASCTIGVRYNAAGSGAKTASLDVTDGTLTASASLSATALTPGNIAIEPSTRDFGTSPIGTATGATTFTVRNTGTATTGALTVAVAGANPADFPIVPGGDGCTGSTLAGGATCTVAVQFQPTVAGARSATLRVQGTPGGTVTAALNGTGEAPAAIEVTPTSADFGSVATGTNSSPVSFTVRNTGGAATTTPTVVLTGVQATQFSIVSNACTGPLAGGASCAVVVRFNPTTTGMKTAVLDVSATTGGRDTADLGGVGITPSQIRANPTTRDFGSVAETDSVTLSVEIINDGMETTPMLSAAISGPGAAQYSIVSNDCTTLVGDPDGLGPASGGRCNIGIRFAPTAQGSFTASLDITGATSGPLAVPLTGVGIADILIQPNVAGDTFDYGDTIVGNTPTRVFRLTNQTTRTLSSFTLVSPPTTGMEFTRTATTCTSMLAAGASCTVTVRFAPVGAAGMRMVDLTATGSGGATETVVLRGNAVGQVRFVSWRVPPGSGTPSTTFPAAFGNRAIGAFYDMELTAQNAGATASPLVTTGATFAGDMNLQQDTCTGTTLAAGATCTIRVRFYPRTVAAASGTVTLTYGPNSAAAMITGNGIVGATIGVTGSADFGTVVATNVGTRTFTVTNSGAVPTANLNFSVSGTRYSLVTGAGAGTCPTTPAPLAAGASCTIVVQFAPVKTDSTTSPFAGNLQVSQGIQVVNTALTARVGSNITITPTMASFATGQGTTSTSQRFTVTNVSGTGTGSIVVGVSAFAGEFPITNNTCSTLAAGATCTFDVAFAPTTTADRAVELRVSDGGYAAGTARVAVANLNGDSQRPAQIVATLSTGPGHTFNPPWSRFQFGYVIEGANSDPFTFTFRNDGDLPSGALSATLTDRDNPFAPGTPAADFDILSTTCSGPLAAGASCTVTARFSPPVGTGAFFRFAALEVAGTPGGTAVVYLSGGSVTAAPLPSVTVTPTPVSFGSTTGGVALPARTFMVSNNTGGDITLNGLRTCVSGTCAPTTGNPNGDSDRFFIDSVGTCGVGTILPGGGTCSFTVRYQPPVGGPFGFDQAEVRVLNTSAFLGRGTVNGTSLAPAALVVTPGGTVTYPTTISGNASPITFTVQNSGDVPTSVAPSAAISGADPSQFVITSNTCTAALAPGSSCTFVVEFRPVGAGSRSATLTVTAGSLSVTRSLSGSGVAAALLGMSPSAPQTCPARAAGTGPSDFQVCTTYTVSNGGGSASPALSLAVTGDFRIQDSSTCVGGSGTGLGVASTSGISLGTGASCTVIVQHAPQSVGADTGVLTVGATGIASVTGNISSSGISALQHTATAAPGTYTAGTVDFGSFAVGAITGSNRVITLTNLTDPATGVLTYSITGTHAADFDMQTDNCSGGTPTRGSGCSVTIRFLPSAAGARTATLTITDGTPEKTAVITLNGTGT